MTDHVAVLQRIRTQESGKVLPNQSRMAALDHAIATCERHAALVARLGELERGWRRQAGGMRPAKSGQVYGQAIRLQSCADDLARVVKEN